MHEQREVLMVTNRGTAHAGAQRGLQVQSFEACNLDQARVHLIDSIDDPRVKRRCRRCFPVLA